MEEKAKQEKLEQIIDGHECEEEPLDLDELMDFEGGKFRRCEGNRNRYTEWRRRN